MTFTEPPEFTVGLVMPADLQDLSDGMTEQQHAGPQVVNFQPSGIINSTSSSPSFVVWWLLGKVTVPDWATSATVKFDMVMLTAATGGSNTSIQVRIGTAQGMAVRIPYPTDAGDNMSFGYSDVISGLASGPQQVSIWSELVAGAGYYQMTSSTTVTAMVWFQ